MVCYSSGRLFFHLSLFECVVVGVASRPHSPCAGVTRLPSPHQPAVYVYMLLHPFPAIDRCFNLSGRKCSRLINCCSLFLFCIAWPSSSSCPWSISRLPVCPSPYLPVCQLYPPAPELSLDSHPFPHPLSVSCIWVPPDIKLVSSHASNNIYDIKIKVIIKCIKLSFFINLCFLKTFFLLMSAVSVVEKKLPRLNWTSWDYTLAQSMTKRSVALPYQGGNLNSTKSVKSNLFIRHFFSSKQ